MNRIPRPWPNRRAHWPLTGAIRIAVALVALIGLASIGVSRSSPPSASPAAGADIGPPDMPLDPLAGDPAPARAAALQLVRAGRHAQAYAQFATLADHGDAAAALIALVMVGHGPSLFGSAWSATPGQLRRWSELAADDAQRQREHAPDQDGGD